MSKISENIIDFIVCTSLFCGILICAIALYVTLFPLKTTQNINNSIDYVIYIYDEHTETCYVITSDGLNFANFDQIVGMVEVDYIPEIQKKAIVYNSSKKEIIRQR